jgi:hypothetical protein
MFANAQILSESFDGTTFPPAGWTNVQLSGSASPGTWQRVSSGTNPTCSPHSGAGMAYYNSYSWSGGNAADLSTQVLNFSSGAFAVSFWMYRDVGQSTKYDSVCVYVNTVGSSSGGTRIGVVNRSRTLAPAEAADGWYQYTFNIPANYNTATNYIIFKATSDFGNRMYIDDVSVFPLLPPTDPTSITAQSNILCEGQSTKLYANGIDGVVYWYAGSCGGTALGTGDSIVVTPFQTTTYYARNFKNNQFSSACASLSVTVNPVYNVVLTETLCASESITLPGGLVADTTGTYSVTVSTVAGCDSTVTLNLTVLPEFSTSFSQTVCNGDTLFYNAKAYTSTGIYTDNLSSINGCDSLVTINLTVLPLIETTLSETICNGDTLSFNGQQYAASGTYSTTLLAANGCDSLVNLQLTVLPLQETVTDQSICFGDTFAWNGQLYFATGTYSDTIVSASGCDSILVLNLTVKNALSGSVNLNICNGDSVFYNGSYYTQGTYTDTLTSASGCDSVVTVHVALYNTTAPTITQNGFVLSVQNFSSYQWIKDGTDIPGATLSSYTATTDGVYRVRVTDANGCTTESAPLNVLGTLIADDELVSFSVFPNPVHDILYITSVSKSNFSLHIWNTAGTEILSEKLMDGKLFVGHLPSGVYILSLTSGNGTQHRMFVKQ